MTSFHNIALLLAQLRYHLQEMQNCIEEIDRLHEHFNPLVPQEDYPERMEVYLQSHRIFREAIAHFNRAIELSTTLNQDGTGGVEAKE